MKRIQIIRGNNITNQADFESVLELNEWLSFHIENSLWW